MKTRCECEHISHFPDEQQPNGEPHPTPNGKPGHPYGAPCSRLVHISPGFHVCQECVDDCWSDPDNKTRQHEWLT